MVRETGAGLLATACFTAPLLFAAPAAADEVPGEQVWRFADPEIVESSGLVVTDDHVVTVNDSGDSGRVFVVDRGTGETVGVTRWEGDPVDVEALAPAGRGHVWVADIGDNQRERDTVEVLRVPVGEGDRTVAPERYELAHPDGPSDAEALLSHPRSGRLLVVTKDVLGGTVLAAPRELSPDGPNELREVGTALGLATGGSFLPDARHFVVRNYGRAVVYRWPEVESVGDLALPEQEQGEAIAVAPDGEVLISTEGVRTPLLRVTWPPGLRAAMEASAQGTTSAAPTPGGEPAGEGNPEESPAEALEPEVWPWVLGTLVLVAMVVVLVRSLRPR